jgi:hypothetical protein
MRAGRWRHHHGICPHRGGARQGTDYQEDYQDYELSGLIEFAQRGLQVDLGFMAMKSTTATWC